MVLNQRRELRCKPRSVVGARILEAEKFKSFTSVALGPKQNAIEPVPSGSLLHCPAREGHDDDAIGGRNSQLGSPGFLNHYLRDPRRGGFLSVSRSRGVKTMRVERHPA